ncbi:hypothetical protein JHW43_007291 [Diplocarpon mali]|nr:hypothetical protein JHW43_007291 [Diplocarpon mali]
MYSRKHRNNAYCTQEARSSTVSSSSGSRLRASDGDDYALNASGPARTREMRLVVRQVSSSAAEDSGAGFDEPSENKLPSPRSPANMWSSGLNPENGLRGGSSSSTWMQHIRAAQTGSLLYGAGTRLSNHGLSETPEYHTNLVAVSSPGLRDLKTDAKNNLHFQEGDLATP